MMWHHRIHLFDRGTVSFTCHLDRNGAPMNPQNPIPISFHSPTRTIRERPVSPESLKVISGFLLVNKVWMVPEYLGQGSKGATRVIQGHERHGVPEAIGFLQFIMKVPVPVLPAHDMIGQSKDTVGHLSSMALFIDRGRFPVRPLGLKIVSRGHCIIELGPQDQMWLNITHIRYSPNTTRGIFQAYRQSP